MDLKIYEGDLVVSRKTPNFERRKIYVFINDEKCLTQDEGHSDASTPVSVANMAFRSAKCVFVK